MENPITNYTAPCHTANTEGELVMCLSQVQALASKLTAAYNAHHALEQSQVGTWRKPDTEWPEFYAAYLLANGVTLR